jgi:hypothetical protein
MTPDIDGTANPTEEDFRKWQAALGRIYADEPPPMRALDALSYNAACKSMGYDFEHYRRVNFWQWYRHGLHEVSSGATGSHVQRMPPTPLLGAEKSLSIPSVIAHDILRLFGRLLPRRPKLEPRQRSSPPGEEEWKAGWPPFRARDPC